MIPPFKIHKSLALLYLLCHFLYSQQSTVKIWSNAVPGALEDSTYTTETIIGDDNQPRIYRIKDPTMDIYPAPEKDSLASAVVICPGGGYSILAIRKEGHDIAQWLNSNGISAFVLKYRLPSERIMENKSFGPLQDGLEAIRIVRRNWKKWRIDPAKIGIMGFSAGGHLASTISTHFADNVYTPEDTTSARPDFSILIYPVISMDSSITHRGSRDNLIGKTPSSEMENQFSNEMQVGAQSPPAFMVHSFDDKSVPVENSIRYALSLKEHSIAVELHLYPNGGHGYGMAVDRGWSASDWPAACIKWLSVNGFL